MRNESKATNRMRKEVRDANSEMRVRRSIAKEQQEQQIKGKQRENARKHLQSNPAATSPTSRTYHPSC
jgi:hypothetical protein